jgi:hypothetical protein
VGGRGGRRLEIVDVVGDWVEPYPPRILESLHTRLGGQGCDQLQARSVIEPKLDPPKLIADVIGSVDKGGSEKVGQRKGPFDAPDRQRNVIESLDQI